MRTQTGRSAAVSALGVAAAAGVVHGGFSLYWGLGGTALNWSLGKDLVSQFEGRELVLVPLAVGKLTVALVPWIVARRTHPMPRPVVVLGWLAAAVLTVWGGVNTLTANLLLTGVIDPAGELDRGGTIGHALIWDPLFVVWGIALAVGLRAVSRTQSPEHKVPIPD